MTHDNHPTAAPLSRKDIEKYRKVWPMDWVLSALCDMALASLARPVPSDMAENVDIIRKSLGDFSDFEDEGPFSEEVSAAKKAIAALDRIVAHLSQAQPRDAKTSGNATKLAKQLADDVLHDLGQEAWSEAVDQMTWRIQQALDAARSEARTSGLEEAATIMDLAYSDAHYRESFTKKELVLSGVRLAKQIRALIPSGQQTKGDGK